MQKHAFRGGRKYYRNNSITDYAGSNRVTKIKLQNLEAHRSLRHKAPSACLFYCKEDISFSRIAVLVLYAKTK